MKSKKKKMEPKKLILLVSAAMKKSMSRSVYSCLKIQTGKSATWWRSRTIIRNTWWRQTIWIQGLKTASGLFICQISCFQTAGKGLPSDGRTIGRQRDFALTSFFRPWAAVFCRSIGFYFLVYELIEFRVIGINTGGDEAASRSQIIDGLPDWSPDHLFCSVGLFKKLGVKSADET